MDAIAFVTLMLAVAAILTPAWIQWRRAWPLFRSLRGRALRWSLGVSAIFLFAMWTYFTALKLLDPAVTAFISRLETFVIILLGVVFFRERFRRIEIPGAALVIAGIVIIRYSSGVALGSGFWVLILSVTLFGIAEAISKKIVTFLDPLVLTLVRNSVLAAAFLIVQFALRGSVALPERGITWLGVVGAAVFGPVLARVYYLRAIELVEISKVALIGQSLPIWVTMIALVFLGTVPTGRELVGGLVLIAGCLMLARGAAAADSTPS
jgi:drug/metabolite transporter (DMT)-like permease